MPRKSDDESKQEEVVDVEKCEEVTIEHEESSEDDSDFDDEPAVVEFEDPVYELSQLYELEPEYGNMTPKQEAVKVQALMPREQAEYQELTKLHQQQAELDEKMTGMSKVITERFHSSVILCSSCLPKGSICTLLLTKSAGSLGVCAFVVWALIKQDDIPRADKPGTSKGYYLFVEDDAGCTIEQGDRRMIRDTDTDQRLPTDLITEEEVATY